MKTNALLLLMSLLLFASCQSDDSDLEVSVFTEEVVFTSGEKVILTGRILTSEDVNVSEHGFHISDNEAFTNPITITLGQRSTPGRFVGEYNDLNIELAYYCRAFIVQGGEEKHGNILNFSTLSPRLIDFEPKEGVKNNRVTIEGVNITSDAIVLWNDKVITPSAIIEETFIEFSVPTAEVVPYAQIRVVAQGDTLSVPGRFEYIYGGWEEGGMIVDTNKNNNHIYFEDAEYFYYGLGINREFLGPSPKIFRLHKESLTRDVLNHNGLATEGSFYTTNGYFGGGSLNLVKNSDPSLLNNSEFYRLDGDATIQLKDVPRLLYKAVAYGHEDYVYVYGGEQQGRDRNTNVYRYDIASNNWNLMTTSPYGPLNEYPHFTVGSVNYFITEEGIMHGHDVMSDTWDTYASYPEEVKKDGINVVLNGLVYVGLQDISRKVFEYNPTENRWRKKKSNPTLDPSETLGTWIDNNQITIMRTNNGSGEDRFFWIFDPSVF